MKLAKSLRRAPTEKRTSCLLKMIGFGKESLTVFPRELLSSWLLAMYVLAIWLTTPPLMYAAAIITVLSDDGAGEGFNDLTPFTPVGGNNATSLGQARLNAFRHATGIWANLLTSSVEIQVEAAMDPLGPGVLGQAGPNTAHRNFPNTLVAQTWYVQILLAKSEISPSRRSVPAQHAGLQTD
jgi:hypothetical protein